MLGELTRVLLETCFTFARSPVIKGRAMGHVNASFAAYSRKMLSIEEEERERGGGERTGTLLLCLKNTKPGARFVPLCCVSTHTHAHCVCPTKQHACTVARAPEQPTGRCFDSWEALMPPCLPIYFSTSERETPPSNAP